MTVSFRPSTLAGFLAILICVLTAWVIQRFRKPATDTANRLESIDGLRGFLALGVFVGHFVGIFYFVRTGRWGGLDFQFYARVGAIGVALFFMVTGFLFWSRLFAKKGRLDWTSLYISRVFRIVPLYWFMVAALTAIVFWVSDFVLKSPMKALVEQILIWLSFADYPNINKFSGTVGVVAGVVWTLKYEWLFYLTLPVQALFVRFSEKSPLPLLALAAATIGFSIWPVYIPYLQVSTTYFVYFLGGAIAAWFYTSGRCRELAKNNWITLLALVSLFLAFALYQNDFEPSQALFLALFFIPIAMGNSIFKILSVPAVMLLGEISYSVYLLHGMVIFVAFFMLLPNLMAAITTPFQLYAAMDLTGVAVVSLCWGTYSLVERPFIHFGKRLSNLVRRPSQKDKPFQATPAA